VAEINNGFLEKLLFICSLGLQRSPTAAEIFKDKYETRSLGIYTASKEEMEKALEWADKVFVMEEEHVKFINHKVINLQVKDQYFYGDEELIKILKEKVQTYLSEF